MKKKVAKNKVKKVTEKLTTKDIILHKEGVLAITKDNTVHILDKEKEQIYHTILQRLMGDMKAAKIQIEHLLDGLVDVNVTYNIRPKK